jgi:hypothetical protein
MQIGPINKWNYQGESTSEPSLVRAIGFHADFGTHRSLVPVCPALPLAFPSSNRTFHAERTFHEQGNQREEQDCDMSHVLALF